MIAEPPAKSSRNLPPRPQDEGHGHEVRESARPSPGNGDEAASDMEMPAGRMDSKPDAGTKDISSLQENVEFDAEDEEAYWEVAHDEQPFAGNDDYLRYASAYRIGFEGFIRLGAENSFDDVEEDLQEEFEAEGSPVPWEKAREASRAAWERLEERAMP